MLKKKILVSQHYYTDSIHQFLKQYHYLIDELFIDSGGFTWWKSGFKKSEEVYFNSYMQKVDKIRELQQYFKVYFIQLDKPMDEEATKLLWNKQKHLKDFYPVFTAGSNLSYLKELSNENSLIFLGAVVNLSNERLYNYL
jgi:hypothetical protein